MNDMDNKDKILISVDQKKRFHNKIDYLKPYFRTGDYRPATIPRRDGWVVSNPREGVPSTWVVWSMSLDNVGSDYSNSINSDMDTITEYAPTNKEDYLLVDDPKTNHYKSVRVVFLKRYEGDSYRFIGLFVPSYEDSKPRVHVFKRIATSAIIDHVSGPRLEIQYEDRIPLDSTAFIQEIETCDVNLVGKEKETLVKARLNQSVFRDLLLKRYGKCLLCGVSDHRLLRASHIKPWSKSEPNEKVDIYNGLLLCPNHDILFDQGFISFDDTGKVICSKEFKDVDQVFMNIQPDMKIQLNSMTNKYMEYHRSHIFLK